ncbi:hypothetical protein [Rubellicoccus peritrichatus]|uniref:Uncharacterized protein n=1 Tax=Rubellicoccus peritrichatus TaxID=3080537 RepID=A0AAQ3L8M8_9BACT|nr:hypothetical protein [Puniceicoccus sp. CR14]WOO39712.1 hypothetical protein RZN69_13900 [Puniceicoccus sp. CR14]
MIRRRHLLTFIAFVFCLGSIASGQSEHLISTPTKSGYKISVFEAFDSIPSRGFLPVRVEILNGSTKDATWRLQTNSSVTDYTWNSDATMTTSRELFVRAGEKRVFEVLCPIPDVDRGTRSFNGTITGPQTFDNWWQSDKSSSYYGRRDVYGLASERLVLQYAGRIRSHLESLGYNLNTTDGHYAFLPADWRAYTGVDLMWFAQSDWESLAKSERDVLLDWTAAGGDLRILKEAGSNEDDGVSGLPFNGKDWDGYGAGIIRVYPPMEQNSLFEKDLSASKIRKQLGASFWEPFRLGVGKSLPLAGDDEEEDRNLTLESTIEVKIVNFPLVIVSMIAFGIVVGPVNLWFFARGRNRYRLLYTTPTIAVVFSLLLAVSILLSDGIGGEGKISRLLLLLPDRNKEILLEAQYCDTGLLLSRSFSVDPTLWIEPLGSSVTSAGSIYLRGDYEEEEGLYWGNWFGSRRIQGLALEQVRASRSEFEVSSAGGGALEVKSSFPGVCRELYYWLDDKRIFKAEALATGHQVELKPVGKKEFNDWLGRVRLRLGSDLDQTLRQMRLVSGQVFADIEHYTGDAPTTLDSIDWEVYETLVISHAKSPLSSKEAGQ